MQAARLWEGGGARVGTLQLGGARRLGSCCHGIICTWHSYGLLAS